MIEVTAAALTGHPFLRGMPPGQLNALAAAASGTCSAAPGCSRRT
jgi:hypothetical protein